MLKVFAKFKKKSVFTTKHENNINLIKFKVNPVLNSEFTFSRCTTGENDSCQLMTRKKRRGVIEKKRRDRINSSLSELKRLVPSAFEKQGSAKLEKAEILQLTVDHLKSLHSKGMLI